MNALPWFKPRAYQDAMVEFILAHRRCALWAPMGSGKTASVLSAADRLRVLGYLDRPILVIATLRVARDTWIDELGKWADFQGLPASAIVGTQAQRRKALAQRAWLYTTNYENLPWLIDVLGGAWPFGMVVLDESTRVKSLRVSVQLSKTGKRFLNGQGGKRAKAFAEAMFEHPDCRVVELTGTPSPNGLQDLWGQLWFIDEGARLGANYTGFEQRWFRTGYGGGLEPLPYAQPQIMQRVADVCLSIDLTEHFPTEKPICTEVKVKLPAEARKVYDSMQRKLFAELGSGKRIDAATSAAKTMKCLQLANGAAYTDSTATQWEVVHDAKLDALESIVEEAAGAPLLVAYHFQSDLARLLKRFPKGRHLDHMAKTLEDFKAGRIPLLFAHPASAGHGIDGLQHACHRIVFFSLNWNLEEHDQIIGRIGPIRQLQAGLKRPVFVYYILAAGTLDGYVLERLRSKRSVQDILLDAMTAEDGRALV